MLKISSLMLLALCAFSAEETKPKPIEDVLWEKAVSDNTKEAEKTYSAYQKALADATSKVTKALEANIKDLNDSKKFPKLGMKERVEAIKALEEKIKGAKEAVGESVAKGKDLLGDGSEVDIKKMIVGKWKRGDGVKYTLSAKGEGNGVWGGVTHIVKWKADNKDPSKVELYYDGGTQVSLTVYIKGETAYCTIQNGGQMNFERVVD